MPIWVPAAQALHGQHGAAQFGRVRVPFAGPAFAEAAIVDQLDIEPAEFLRRLEHLGLDMQRPVPLRLTAGGGVHGEDQPPAHARAALRRRLDLLQEGVDLGSTGGFVQITCHRTSLPRPRTWRGCG
ncbi:MAG: hypothetical protein ACMVY4_03025 [Minwuia sp.]|uniref:hypothetical protein n=1 Tax=Minwuia sp. TaxID=2493630 RepID=UPI003A84F631